jgi:hypothetical protein
MRCLLLELAEISIVTHNMYHSHALERPSEQILPGFGIPYAQADASQGAASACLHHHVQSPHNCRLPRRSKFKTKTAKRRRARPCSPSPHCCRAAKGVGKKMTAALESLKVGWGGGSGAASPSSGPATPKGAVISG